MRGKGIVPNAEAEPDGITPAYAGKSIPYCEGVVMEWDHPRVCGEKMLEKSFVESAPGSPPRMRGKVYSFCNERLRFGITPAYAGKRLPQPGRSSSARDHPRVCGEKFTEELRANAGQGSPPRMRGKEPLTEWLMRQLGITPAYAGKS